MTTSTLLTDLIPSKSEFLLSRTERINKSKFTSAAQVIGSPTGLWEVSLTFSNIHRSDAKKLIARLVSMRGSQGTFLLSDWSSPKPDGIGGTYPVTNISSSAPGIVEILTSHPNKALAVAGDYVSIDNELKLLVDDAITDATGRVTLVFEPFMRTPVTAATKVTFDNPVGEFRLKPGYKVPRPTTGKLVFSEIKISAIEAVTV